MRHEHLEQAYFATPLTLEVRKLTFKLFPRDEADNVAKFILKSLMDDMDEVSWWLEDQDAGNWAINCEINADGSIDYVLKVMFQDQDQAFHFRVRWL